MNLEKPLLSHAWSAAFSFSKCHIEETAPYDPFTPYIMSAEQFPRFARYVSLIRIVVCCRLFVIFG